MSAPGTKRRTICSAEDADSTMGRVKITTHEPPRALFPFSLALERNEITPLQYLEAFILGDAPPPVRIGSQLFFDADMFASWRAKKRVEAMDAAKRCRASVWEISA
jgi:hypothetical protein